MKALWRNRHQVWQRLEENGQIAMKVVPSQIEFTLPSPKLGIESIPVIDPPWIPKTKAKISTIHESGQVGSAYTPLREWPPPPMHRDANRNLLSDAAVSYEKPKKAAGRGRPMCHPRRGRKATKRARKLSHHFGAHLGQGGARAQPLQRDLGGSRRGRQESNILESLLLDCFPLFQTRNQQIRRSRRPRRPLCIWPRPCSRPSSARLSSRSLSCWMITRFLLMEPPCMKWHIR